MENYISFVPFKLSPLFLAMTRCQVFTAPFSESEVFPVCCQLQERGGKGLMHTTNYNRGQGFNMYSLLTGFLFSHTVLHSLIY